MTMFKFMLLAASATLAASAATAQTANVAVIDPTAAMLAVKSIGPAYKAIGDQYRAVFTQAQTREQTLQTTLAPLQKRLDTNNDGRIDDNEAAAAQTANKPEVQQIVTAQQNAQNEINTLLQPSRIAQAWVLDQVRQKYRTALTSVATAKRLGLVVTTDTVSFATPAADITDDVTTALNTAAPTLTTTPPAGWQPDRETAQLFQQFTQYLQVAQARAAQAGAQPAASGARPAPAAAGTKRDRNGDPIKQ